MDDIALTDFSMTTASTANVAGGGMMTTLGSTLNQISNILSGPVLYVILGLSVVLTVYGPNRYNITICGIGTFILTAMLKGFAALLHGA